MNGASLGMLGLLSFVSIGVFAMLNRHPRGRAHASPGPRSKPSATRSADREVLSVVMVVLATWFAVLAYRVVAGVSALWGGLSTGVAAGASFLAVRSCFPPSGSPATESDEALPISES